MGARCSAPWPSSQRYPPEHVLRKRAPPVLVAFRPAVVQDLENLDMNALQQAQALYAEWVQQTQRDAHATLLADLLAERFGDVPPEARERIEHASGDTLRRWARRVLRAQTLADVFG